MKEYLNEIKKITQEGLEKAIINGETNSKNYFYQILLKTEIELNKIEFNVEKETAKNVNKSNYEHLGDRREKMLIVAYCLSNYEHTSLYSDLTQSEAFNKICDTLEIKKSTLKLTRDMFDGHNNSSRKGWQAELPDSLKIIKEKYDKLTKDDVIKEVKKILNLK